jgi:hypothetical protein
MFSERAPPSTTCGTAWQPFLDQMKVHPSVIQSTLRHDKQQTTARYIHAMNAKQIEAQGKDLDGIKIGVKQPDRAA